MPRPTERARETQAVRRFKIHKAKLLSTLLVLLVLVLCPWTHPVQAQGPMPPSSDCEVARDPELTALWEKYSHLLASQQVPLDELQKMIG